jgi:hypothetical protein
VYGSQVYTTSHTLFLTAGKQWKAISAPNKNPSLRTTFSKRISKAKQVEATKALERQLIEERKAAVAVFSSHPKVDQNRRKKRRQRREKRPTKRRKDMN